MQEPTKEQMNDFLFMNLIMQYQQMAWIQLGKVKNPATDKLEKDLQGAKFSIDLLDMIKAKTAGNLKSEEDQMLNHAISELQLNYVDEVNKEAKEKESASEEKAEPEAKEEQAASEEKAEPETKEETPKADSDKTKESE